ncbi:MAG: UDP-glucose 4-epimerase GalE [Alphaproteobacteria bacterium]|nr:UDP-glucose 4-epimerase GalE [Alphaproteobacteria bacterium]
MSKQKILVIGGAGYIGSHVVKALLEENFSVTVYDNLSTGQLCNLFNEADFIKGDISDEKKLNQTMAVGFDAVVHLAAKKAVGESMENPQKYSLNNINGSINIFNAMVNNGIKNVVFSSTAAVYGIPQYLPLDEKHSLNPLNFYGFTKAEIERIMDWYSRLKDFHFIALRYFNAVGYATDGSIRGKEKNPQNLLPIVMEVATGKRDIIHVFGNDYDTPDGTCVRDYIHVEDLARAHIAAIKKLLTNPQSHIINLATNKGTSVLEIIRAAERVTGRKIKYDFAPRRSGDPAVVVASNALAQKLLGWQPQYTDIDEIIKTTWNLEEK